MMVQFSGMASGSVPKNSVPSSATLANMSFSQSSLHAARMKSLRTSRMTKQNCPAMLRSISRTSWGLGSCSIVRLAMELAPMSPCTNEMDMRGARGAENETRACTGEPVGESGGAGASCSSTASISNCLFRLYRGWRLNESSGTGVDATAAAAAHDGFLCDPSILPLNNLSEASAAPARCQRCLAIILLKYAMMSSASVGGVKLGLLMSLDNPIHCKIPASCAVRLSCECVTQYTTLVPSHADTLGIRLRAVTGSGASHAYPLPHPPSATTMTHRAADSLSPASARSLSRAPSRSAA
mmetsp:Transcript_18624/g.29806  ORF Transcript_18624/g.29806 Transcript_18624/m.29806 type:complete len:297 (-) Transcript_18624:230-1120(-)